MKGLILVIASCVVLSIKAQYPESINPSETKGHEKVFEDGELTRVLSKLLGQEMQVRPPVAEVERAVSNIRGSSEQQYGPPQGNELNLGPVPPEIQNYGPSQGLSVGPPGPPPERQQQYGPPQQLNFGPNPPPQYGPPGQDIQNNNQQQYGPPPQSNNNQQYGPPPQGPPNNNQQQYGPPPQGPPNNNQQQYGPPPQGPSNNNQQYGPPPQGPSNNYQQYGPPPQGQPNNINQQQYGPPQGQDLNLGPVPPQEQYGPPQGQLSGPPEQQYGPPPQGPSSEPPNQQYGPPPPGPSSGPPPRGTGRPREYSISAEFSFGDRLRPRQRPSRPPPPPPRPQPPQPSPPQQQQNFPSLTTSNFFQNNFQGPPAPNSAPPPPQPFFQNNQFQQEQGQQQNQQQVQQGGYQVPQGGNDGQSGGTSGNIQGNRFVYIYAPPPEPNAEPQRPLVINPPQKPDVNYQIIFVKAPAPPDQAPVEIQMPEAPEQKTLVYVLVKKNQNGQQNIRFTSPPTTTPSPPEVYFIKYRKTQDKGNLPSTSDGNYGLGGSSSQENFQTEQISEKYQIPQNQEFRPSQFLGDPRSNTLTSGGYQSDGRNGDSRTTSSEELSSGGYSSQGTSGVSSSEEVSGGYQNVVGSGGGNSRDPIKLLASPRFNLASTSDAGLFTSNSEGSHYTAPGSRPWENSSTKMGGDIFIPRNSNGGRMKTNEYRPPSTSSGGYQ